MTGGTGVRQGPGAERLVGVLERARALGFLGPGPVAGQIEHAYSFGAALAPDWEAGPNLVLADLGAGGGVPSLPLLLAEPGMRMVLVDASRKRSSFLVWATVELGLAERAEVWCGRAEVFGHQPGRREAFDAVVARGFGPPSSALECGAPLLRPGGRLVVSEPPGYRHYPAAGVARCGLGLVAQRHGCAVFERLIAIDEALPRPWREQERHPCFEL
jgi:rRNA small subunit methyltransferase G